MSDKLGPIVYGSSDANEVFLGRDFGHTRNYSEEIAAKIDEEVYRLLSDSYAATEKTLNDHMDKLREVAERLIEDEKMDGDTFKAIMESTALPQETE
jgi:cell division protease FtsH